ncbi:MAG: hypothetical protein C0602_00175 [Denitrovibrio sp.]|nr:MAG: hypothetical protein C0602_00175 [Denitrovibrio sp.]
MPKFDIILHTDKTPERVLVETYERMIADRSLDAFFFNGTGRTYEEFYKMLNDINNIVYFGFIDHKLSGMCWLNSFRQKSAYLHPVVFSDAWGKNSVELGKRSLKTIFELKNKNGEYILELLQGLAPSDNKLAVKYLQKCGMNILGELPNAFVKHDGSVVSVILGYCTRQEVLICQAAADQQHQHQ